MLLLLYLKLQFLINVNFYRFASSNLLLFFHNSAHNQGDINNFSTSTFPLL